MAYVTGKSGSFSFQDANKQFTLKVNWTETYDIATNSSIISIDSYQLNSTMWGGTWNPCGLIKVNDELVATFNYYNPSTHKVTISAGSNFYSFEAHNNGVSAPWVSSPIAHNTDGSKSITISVVANPAGHNLSSIQIYRASDGKIVTFGASQASTVELTDIPRAATLTAAPNFTDEDNPTITYNNPAGEAVDKLEACISLTSARADIAYREVSKTGTSYTFSLTEAEREVLRLATLDGSASRTVYFILQTTIAGVTYRSPLAKTFTVVNAEPQISALVMDINEKTVALTGDRLTRLIKGYSNVGYELTATAQKGAIIAGYRATNGSAVFTTASGTFAATQSADFTFSATDNRGQTATENRKFNLVEYFKPTCDAEATLELDGETTARAEVTITGTFFNASFGAVKNSIEILIKHSAANDWISLTNDLYFEPSINGNTYIIDFGVSGLDYTQPFTYQCKVIDKLDSATSAEDTKTIYPVFDWSAEDFNFNVPISMNGNQTIRATDTGRIVISANEGDIYLRPNGSTTDAGQLRITTTGLALLDGVRLATLDMLYPIGSIYLSVNSTNPSSYFGGTWERIQDKFILAAGSTYGAGTTGGSATHTHALGNSAYAQINHHDGAFWFKEIDGVSYAASGKGTSTGANVTNTQSSAVPLGGTTNSASSLPPYLAVYVWKRTA